MHFEGCGILLKRRIYPWGACMHLEWPRWALFSWGVPRKPRANWGLDSHFLCELLLAGFTLLLNLALASRPWCGFHSTFFSNGEKKIGCRGVVQSKWQCKNGIDGLSQQRCFCCGSHWEFSPSQEKIRVMLMTIADGAMLSLTLYELKCSKKCCELWGVFWDFTQPEHE
jgi:hypothetical protein